MTFAAPVFAVGVFHLPQGDGRRLPLIFPQTHGTDAEVAFAGELQQQAGVAIGGVRPHLSDVFSSAVRAGGNGEKSECS